ncbi:hypothetical protein LCGC14_1208600, partial [marine sediment metagenome]
THNFDLEQPEVVDGTLPWMWWDEIDEIHEYQQNK